MAIQRFVLASLALATGGQAMGIAPAAAREAAVAAAAGAMITPAPARPVPFAELRRDIFSDIKTLGEGIYSDLGSIGSQAASAVTSAFGAESSFFANLPDGKDAVLSKLGINETALSASPTQVLNIPGYGNWTDQGWNLRFRANVYKQPNASTSKLDDLANDFLIGTKIQDLPPAEQTQARNVTAEIFVVQQDNQNLTFDIFPAESAGASGQQGGGGADTPPGGTQTIKYPVPSTKEGDIDGFVVLKGDGLKKGNETTNNQRLSVYAQGATLGNATAYLVPPEGYTIISDIDDILRVTQIYKPSLGILNTFAKPFTPWMNMPDIYANWSTSIAGLHFHYLTTTPEQATRNYMDFIYKTYPGGSFDTRPLNFSDISATISIRKYLLERVFRTFPKRKFILVADTSNSDVMRDYPAMATEFPGQVSCILLRNTSSTDSEDHFPYNTKGFKGLDAKTYMFFHVPDDLKGIDISNGGCVNKTIKQNVSFELQGLPFGINSEAGRTNPLGRWGWAILAAAMAWML